ncbi:hypothetical protein BCR33DRAFT_725450 [Rhizoclosmatium globosum]|uniref:Uncharacterized protein n=1 Tax=Rhizoclosmatium globosum TaxID=329046 RepID=A0A1Y2AYK5_9FUNG|nr:hypothetical protein BCR33DRAFT_725450 [Rhizoclosmatium globosum]|eukprot:ORY27566.1 hypothetical protein BCR33DRAFT_725450 [Rhizoclosmatium globosum]
MPVGQLPLVVPSHGSMTHQQLRDYKALQQCSHHHSPPTTSSTPPLVHYNTTPPTTPPSQYLNHQSFQPSAQPKRKRTESTDVNLSHASEYNMTQPNPCKIARTSSSSPSTTASTELEHLKRQQSEMQKQLNDIRIQNQVLYAQLKALMDMMHNTRNPDSLGIRNKGLDVKWDLNDLELFLLLS